jgi:hypothetical protein
MTAVALGPSASVRSRRSLVLLATLFGIALNWTLEVIEWALWDSYADLESGLLENLAMVALWSAVAGLLALGLVRLGRKERVRSVVAWVAVLLAGLTVLPMYWAAVPASFAAAAWVLARGRGGSLAAVRVLAFIVFGAFVVVSIGMFPFAEV